MAARLGVDEGAMWREFHRFMRRLHGELVGIDVDKALATEPDTEGHGDGEVLEEARDRPRPRRRPRRARARASRGTAAFCS
jgi:hypothetical protein